MAPVQEDINAELVRHLRMQSGRINTLEITLGLVLRTMREAAPGAMSKLHAEMREVLGAVAERSTDALPDERVDAAIALPLHGLLEAARPR